MPGVLSDLYPTLGEHVRLKPTPSCCWLVDGMSGGERIHSLEAFVLALCTGENTSEDIAYLVNGVLEKGDEWSGHLVDTTLHGRSAHLEFFRTAAPRNLRHDPARYLYPLEPTARTPEERLDSPGELITILTHHCNFRCVYCFNSADPGKNHVMSTDEWLRVLAEAAGQGVVRCTISGGEPMTHPGFREILRAVLAHGMVPYACTNGSLVDADDVRYFSDLGLPFIQISLDTVDDAVHDRMSQAPGSLDAVRSAIQSLVGAGIDVFVKSVVTPLNVDGLADLIDRCHDWGVKRLTLDRFDLSNAGRGNLNLFLSRDQEIAMGELAAERRERYADDGFDITAVDIPRCWNGKDDIIVCGALSTGMTILPDGRVSVCEKVVDYPELTVGDVRQQSLAEIWNSPRAHRVLRPEPEAIDPTCAECSELVTCHTGCFAQTLIVSDTPYGPDPRCWKARYPANPYAAHAAGAGGRGDTAGAGAGAGAAARAGAGAGAAGGRRATS